MCFWYNTLLTFSILEQNQQTVQMFQSLLQTIPTLKHDFELRRVIFGLTSIISIPHNQLPGIVAQRLPDILKQIALLSIKSRDQRLDVLKDNEEELEEQKKKQSGQEAAQDDEEDEVEEIEGEEDKEDEEEGTAAGLLVKNKKKKDEED